MSSVHWGILPLLSLIAASPCGAAAITNIEIINNSSPSYTNVSAIRAREFQTQFEAPQSGTRTGDTVSFTTRAAWTSSHRVFPGPSGLPLTHGNSVAYDIVFTVEDPTMAGYDLTFDSSIRGYVSAFWEDNVGAFPSFVFTSGTLMAPRLDDGSGFGPLLSDITTDAEVAVATPADPQVSLLVARQGTHNAGHWIGTRTFTLRYGAQTSNTGVGLQNYNIGEGNVRFGLDSDSPHFRYASYPGSDGEPASAHGHFVTATAQFGPAAAVPEPATFGAIGIALLLIPFLKTKKG